MTSAPMSARSIEAYGPVMKAPCSMTRMPVSGPPLGIVGVGGLVLLLNLDSHTVAVTVSFFFT